VRATFPTKDLGRHRFQVVAVIDRFASWRRDTLVKANDGQDVAVDLALGRSSSPAPPCGPKG